MTQVTADDLIALLPLLIIAASSVALMLVIAFIATDGPL